jgi:hypothetical protein
VESELMHLNAIEVTQMIPSLQLESTRSLRAVRADQAAQNEVVTLLTM